MTATTIQLDRVFGPLETTIDADHAAGYALATNDPNPVYQDEGVAPPVFTVSLGLHLYLESMRDGVPAGAVRGATGGVHGQHDTYLHRPLMAGDPVRITAQNHCAYNTPAGAMTSSRLLIADPDGAPIVEHFWSTFHIKGEVEEVGPRLADHTFPEEAREKPLGVLRIPVTRDQSYRYAGSSNDHAPIHMHDGPAQGMGFPKKFMQGLCTFAMCSQAVVNLAADGDPRPVRRLAARFASPVFQPAELEVSVFDAGAGPEGRRSVAFEASVDGTPVIKHGRAELDA